MEPVITHSFRIWRCVRRTVPIENARDAAQNWISVELEEFEGDLPFATHVDDIELAENQVAKQIMVKIKFLPDSD